MDTMTMLQTSVYLFALAALGGLTMAVMRFTRPGNPPNALAMGHGLLAGAGLTLLLYAVFTAAVPTMAQLGAALLVVAALGGVVLNLAYHQKGVPLPKGIVVVHALVAIAGFGLLLPVAFG